MEGDTETNKSLAPAPPPSSPSKLQKTNRRSRSSTTPAHRQRLVPLAEAVAPSSEAEDNAALAANEAAAVLSNARARTSHEMPQASSMTIEEDEGVVVAGSAGETMISRSGTATRASPSAQGGP